MVIDLDGGEEVFVTRVSIGNGSGCDQGKSYSFKLIYTRVVQRLNTDWTGLTAMSTHIFPVIAHRFCTDKVMT